MALISLYFPMNYEDIFEQFIKYLTVYTKTSNGQLSVCCARIIFQRDCRALALRALGGLQSK